DVFVNVTGGLRLTDPAADLSLALAIISSYKNLSLPINSLALGELGLLGEIRPIAYLDKRLKEAKNLGYQPLDPKINNLKKLSATLFSSSTKPQKPQASA
ncbi:MAG: DNA repair protein RadA, partial [Chloroflexi bacterium]|nr:DNA repair protein RadA [Chloroflexota bacterium]